MTPQLRALTIVFFAAVLASACTKEESRSEETQPSASTANRSVAPRDSEVARFHVEALTCEGCAATLRGILTPEPGILAVQADVQSRSLTVTYDPKQTSPSTIAAVLKKADYDTEPLPASDALGLE